MPKVISKVTLQFRNPDKPSEVFKVTPGPNPVEAPEWLEDDELFELAVADGSIVIPQAIGSTPNSVSLQKVPNDVLMAEVLRRGLQPSMAGTTVQPMATSDKAKADQQARAEAANKANAGKGQESGPMQAEPVKQGDERTSREEAATTAATDQAASKEKQTGADKPIAGTPAAGAQGVTTNK